MPELWLPSDTPHEAEIRDATEHINAPHAASGQSQQAYENLLAALRKDLQLDAAIDVLAGTVGQALVNDGSPTATTATAGGAPALPATPAGYLVLRGSAGTVYKVPFYKP